MPADSEKINDNNIWSSVKAKLLRFAHFRYKKPVLITLTIIIVGVVAISAVHRIGQKKATHLDNQAQALSVSGNYNAAASKVIEAYNSENRTEVKANLAYEAGVDYFNAKDTQNGKKWMQIAIDTFNKAGDKEKASASQEALNQLEAANQKVNNTELQQKASSRNVQDSNL
jgi:hypothetical protein